MTCERCGGTGWIIRERGPYSGAEECSCRQANWPTEPRTLLTAEEALSAVTILCETLSFAPSTTPARVLIANGLMEMCETAEQVRYVVSRAVMLHTKWSTCGLPGLRQILCSKYRPRDGHDITITENYPDGIPPDKPVAEVEKPLTLPPSFSATIDPALDRDVRALARAKAMPPPMPAKPISKADIDAVLEKRKHAQTAE